MIIDEVTPKICQNFLPQFPESTNIFFYKSSIFEHFHRLAKKRGTGSHHRHQKSLNTEIFCNLLKNMDVVLRF